jgi:L-alanine-DL-glutamate epimerase-like enolase superfamily enzyme
VNFRLAASTPDLLILETTKAGWARHFELIGHPIQWEKEYAILPNGCGLGFEFNEEFARSHVHTGDRLRLEMQDEPGIH